MHPGTEQQCIEALKEARLDVNLWFEREEIM